MIALVGSQLGGTETISSPTVDQAFPANVTGGSRIVVVVHELENTPGTGGVTQFSGSATLGTITRDGVLAAGGNQVGIGIYSALVIGSGSLTMRYTQTGTRNANAIAVGEFSAIASSGFVGLTPSNTGTGTAHTSGSIANTSGSLLIYGASELSTVLSTPARSVSDQLIHKQDDGGTNFTNVSQYKIAGGTPNTLTDTFNENVGWFVLVVEYLVAVVGPASLIQAYPVRSTLRW